MALANRQWTTWVLVSDVRRRREDCGEISSGVFTGVRAPGTSWVWDWNWGFLACNAEGCESRFHHGADAATFAGAAPHACLGCASTPAQRRRTASVSWLVETSHARAIRESSGSPRGSTALVINPRGQVVLCGSPGVGIGHLPRAAGEDGGSAVLQVRGTRLGLCRWPRAVWYRRGGLLVALPPWG